MYSSIPLEICFALGLNCFLRSFVPNIIITKSTGTWLSIKTGKVSIPHLTGTIVSLAVTVLPQSPSSIIVSLGRNCANKLVQRFSDLTPSSPGTYPQVLLSPIHKIRIIFSTFILLNSS